MGPARWRLYILSPTTFVTLYITQPPDRLGPSIRILIDHLNVDVVLGVT